MPHIKPFYVSNTDPPQTFDTWRLAHTYELAEAIKALFPAGMIEDPDLLDRLSERMAADLVHEVPEAEAAWDRFSDVARQIEPTPDAPTIPFEHNPRPVGSFGKLSSMLKGIPETKNSRLREVPK